MSGIVRRGDRVHLRQPEESDRAAFAVVWTASRELHDPWVDPDDPDRAFDRLLDRNRTDTDRSSFVIRNDDGAIAGMYNLSQIFRGGFQNAYLGYAAFEPLAGQGYMREGMHLLLANAFSDLGLHRLQANVQPGNDRSIALLRATGWREEGFALRYLKIRGEWCDHLLFAIVTDEVPDPRRRRP